MKFAVPEISWHNRDPVLSVDFQPKTATGDPLRLATGGTDTHVLIWYISTTETGSVNLEVAADLARHQKAVNVVRWAPSGELLASGDDESIIFIWKQKNEEPAPSSIESGEEVYKETWVVHKTLRGHMEDLLDICWSPNSLQLASGSVDNKLLLWDVTRSKYSAILTDHKGFVQGVAWDPKSQLIVTASSDRTFRTFDISTKKVVSRSSKAILPFPKEHPLHDTQVRLYHDDTLQTYYRRLQFSPDGLLIAVPAGRIEPEQATPDFKPMNAVYIYTRYSLKVPVCVLPCGEAALVARWSPVVYSRRDSGPPPTLPLPLEGRMVLAVATKRSILIYDTQQRTPIAIISNIHYTRLTDLTWSPDGQTLVASSTDGFCSVVMFSPAELGEGLPQPQTEDAKQTEPMEQTVEVQEKTEPEKEKDKPEETKCTTPKIKSYMKFKTPTEKEKSKQEKSPKRRKSDNQKKTPVKLDIFVETAMPSWSDNSQTEIIKPAKDQPIEVMEIEDSEDIQLVYEDTKMEDSAKKPDDKLSEQSDSKTSDKKGSKRTTDIKQKSDKDASEGKTIEDSSKILKDSSKTLEDSSKILKDSSKTLKDSSKIPKDSLKTLEDSSKTLEDSSKKSPEKKGSPKQVTTPTSSKFFEQAKVTDVKKPAGPSVPSPKAPRRVSFVTLSSPKNKKKL